jgi:hypothetical protein
MKRSSWVTIAFVVTVALTTLPLLCGVAAAQSANTAKQLVVTMTNSDYQKLGAN